MGYLPIYSLDKARIFTLVPLKVVIQLKKRAAERNVTLSNYISAVLYSSVLNDPWTEEDEALRTALVEENRRKRNKVHERLNNKRTNDKKKGH